MSDRKKYSKQDVLDMIDEIGLDFPNVDPSIIKGIIQVESNFDVYAKNKEKVGNTAAGLGQHTKASQKDNGISDPFDPIQNIRGTYNYINKNMKRYNGDVQKAVLAYNQGPGNVKKDGAVDSNHHYLKVYNKYVKNYSGNNNNSGMDFDDKKKSNRLNSNKTEYNVKNDTAIAASNDIVKDYGLNEKDYDPQAYLNSILSSYDNNNINNQNKESFNNELRNIEDQKNNLNVNLYETNNQNNNNSNDENNVSNENEYDEQAYINSIIGSNNQEQNVSSDYNISNNNQITPKTPLSSSNDVEFEQQIDRQNLPLETGIDKTTWMNNRDQKGYKVNNFAQSFMKLEDPVGFLSNLNDDEYNTLKRVMQIYARNNPNELKKIRDEYGSSQGFSYGAMKGFNDIKTGLGAMSGAAVEALGFERGKDARAYYQNENLGMTRSLDLFADLTDNKISTTAGEISASIAATAPLPLAGLKNGVSLGRNAATVGANVAVQDFLTSNARQSDLGEFTEQKVKNAAIAGGIGTALPFMAGGLSKLRGTRNAAELAADPYAVAGQKAQQEMQAQGYKGYDQSWNDELYKTAGGEKLTREIGELARNNPKLNKQTIDNVGVARKNINDWREKFVAEANSSNSKVADRLDDTLKNIQNNNINNYSYQAKELSDKVLQTNPADTARMFQNSNEIDLLNKKVEATKLYNSALDLIDDSVNYQAKNVDNYMATMRNSYANSNVRSTDDLAFINRVQDTFPNGFDNLKLKDYEDGLQLLKGELRDVRRVGNTKLEKNYIDLIQKLEKDLDVAVNNSTAGSANSEFGKKIKEARNYYRENVVPREKQYYNLFHSKNNKDELISPENILNKVIVKGDVSKTNDAFKLLPEESKNYLRTAIFDEIIAKSRTGGNSADAISLSKFVKNIDSYANSKTGHNVLYEVIFDKKQIQNMKNFVKGVDKIRKIAGDSELVLKTGGRIFDYFSKSNLGKAAIGGATGAGALSLGAGAVPALVLGGGVALTKGVRDRIFLNAIMDPKMSSYFSDMGRSSLKSDSFSNAVMKIFGKGVVAEEKYKNNKEIKGRINK